MTRRVTLTFVIQVVKGFFCVKKKRYKYKILYNFAVVLFMLYYRTTEILMHA